MHLHTHSRTHSRTHHNGVTSPLALNAPWCRGVAKGGGGEERVRELTAQVEALQQQISSGGGGGGQAEAQKAQDKVIRNERLQCTYAHTHTP